MTIHPQAPRGARWGVHNLPRSSPPWGRANQPPTWADAGFSTIHTPYYCYYLFYR